MRFKVFAVGLAMLLAGCGGEEKKPASGGINISAPGVNINVDPSGNTNVQAPGVNIDANAKGANITAPGVDIKAKN